MITLQSYYTLIHRSCDPRAKSYVLNSDFVAILHRQLGLNSQNRVDIPALAENLAISNWVPYPKFLAMFEVEKPRVMATDDAQMVFLLQPCNQRNLGILSNNPCTYIYRCILLTTA